MNICKQYYHDQAKLDVKLNRSMQGFPGLNVLTASKLMLQLCNFIDSTSGTTIIPGGHCKNYDTDADATWWPFVYNSIYMSLSTVGVSAFSLKHPHGYQTHTELF